MKHKALTIFVSLGVFLAVVIIVCVIIGLAFTSEEESVDGGFSAWEAWSSCLTTCGGSIQFRERNCDNPAPTNKGRVCKGDFTASQPCSENKCPAGGHWSVWSEWRNCTGSCDAASQSRSRLCDNPAPEPGGAHCAPPATESRTCDLEFCSVNGSWGDWGSWEPCKESFAFPTNGSQTRTRLCNSPPPGPKGNNDCTPPASETHACTPKCVNGWLQLPDSSKCVKKISERLSFEAARKDCQLRAGSGTLVSIHSQAQHEFLKTEVAAGDAYVWIGLHEILSEKKTAKVLSRRVIREDSFLWTDGTVVNFTHFHADEPNGGTFEDCVSYSELLGYTWNDFPCSTKIPYICQKGGSIK